MTATGSSRARESYGSYLTFRLISCRGLSHPRRADIPLARGSRGSEAAERAGETSAAGNGERSRSSSVVRYFLGSRAAWKLAPDAKIASPGIIDYKLLVRYPMASPRGFRPLLMRTAPGREGAPGAIRRDAQHEASSSESTCHLLLQIRENGAPAESSRSPDLASDGERACGEG